MLQHPVWRENAGSRQGVNCTYTYGGQVEQAAAGQPGPANIVNAANWHLLLVQAAAMATRLLRLASRSRPRCIRPARGYRFRRCPATARRRCPVHCPGQTERCTNAAQWYRHGGEDHEADDTWSPRQHHADAQPAIGDMADAWPSPWSRRRPSTRSIRHVAFRPALGNPGLRIRRSVEVSTAKATAIGGGLYRYNTPGSATTTPTVLPWATDVRCWRALR